ncbi:MAG: hypothetical protein A3E74_05940 [Omnitrophica bacterium RIFCSPHIGHO2_12_FULL_44_12]|nr:MAG: hypothetical protein A3E74_05940 [Omnitrophica bacterium RIFCSPHIGHO2_12_FULL_44_12]
MTKAVAERYEFEGAKTKKAVPVSELSRAWLVMVDEDISQLDPSISRNMISVDRLRHLRLIQVVLPGMSRSESRGVARKPFALAVVGPISRNDVRKAARNPELETESIRSQVDVARAVRRIAGLHLGKMANEIYRQVIPEAFAEESVGQGLTQKEFEVLGKKYTEQQIKMFERIALVRHGEFGVNYYPVLAEMNVDDLSAVLEGVQSMVENHPYKVMVFAAPFKIPENIREKINQQFNSRVFLFGEVNDYAAFVDQVVRSGSYRKDQRWVNRLLQKAQSLYLKSGQKGDFNSIEGRSNTAQVAGMASVFNGYLATAAHRFLIDNSLQIVPAEYLRAQIAFGLVAAGKPDAETIRKLTDDYLLIRLVDGTGSRLSLSLNPERLGDILTILEMFQVVKKAVEVAA